MRRILDREHGTVKPPNVEPRVSPPGPAASGLAASADDAAQAMRAFLEQRARQEVEMRARLLDEAETSERLAKGWRW